MIVLLPVFFTAQACNFLFGDIFGTSDQGSGTRGVFMSVDSGETWAEMNNSSGNAKLGNGQVNSLFIEQYNPANILAATLNAGVFASADSGESWLTLLPDFGAYDVFINPNNNQKIYAAGVVGKMAAIYRSDNRGGAWVQIYNQPNSQAQVSAMAFDSANPSIVYAGLSSGTIIKTTDGGSTWKNITNFSDRVLKLAVASNSSRTVYALLATSGLKQSVDGGANWASVLLSETPGNYNDLIINGASGSTLLVATNIGLFRSDDSGRSWKKLLLPATPAANNISAVAINPENSRQIFAAIRWTFYRSDDSGGTWRTVALPTRRAISDIVINPKEPNRIYAGLR